ncbi:hypothetical protein SCLCIDRAFT_75643, partial [Scleroderma citrinum Foug A]
LDSSATGCFVDKSWALDNVDGTRNQEGDITHYLWCAVMCLGKLPLILGHDWLKKHNPDIDWTTGDIKLS